MAVVVGVPNGIVNDESPGEGWWQASDGEWYPPVAHPGEDWYVGGGGTWSPVGGWRRPYDFAATAAGAGWIVLIFFGLWLGSNSDAGDTCAAGRVVDYQACARREEQMMLIAGAIALGFGWIALVGAARGMRRRGARQVFTTALLLSVPLVCAGTAMAFVGESVVLPERELPYAAMSNQGVAIVVGIASLLGAALGSTLPVAPAGRQQDDRDPGP